jgi:hypothetical protein
MSNWLGVISVRGLGFYGLCMYVSMYVLKRIRKGWCDGYGKFSEKSETTQKEIGKHVRWGSGEGGVCAKRKET